MPEKLRLCWKFMIKKHTNDNNMHIFKLIPYRQALKCALCCVCS